MDLDPNSMNLADIIAPNMELALRQHGHVNDDLCWDLCYTMMPGPQGMMLLGFVIISMKSPILGQPGLSAPIQVNPLLMKDSKQAETVVLQALASLRELKAHLLSPENGGAVQGLITPP